MKKLTILTLVFTGISMIGFPLNAKSKITKYHLKTCLVSDNKLGSMGKIYRFVHDKKQEILLCCKPCFKKFEKSPAKYLKKLSHKDQGRLKTFLPQHPQNSPIQVFAETYPTVDYMRQHGTI